MRAVFILAAVSALAASVPAVAQTYSARGVNVVDAAAVVRVIPEDRSDFAVDITAGARLAAPQARLAGGRLVIDGDLHSMDCRSIGSEPAVHIRGVGDVRRHDLPVVTIHAPRTLDVSTHGAVFAEIGASAGGRLAFSGCGDNSVAAVSGDLDLATNGSGDIDLAAVSGRLEAMISGSGDLRADDAHSARLALSGSGDVTLGHVNGALDAALNGSGDVRVNDVEGGAVAMRLAGSGDLTVEHGRADRLDAELAGSGDLTFGGHVGELDARLAGSGDLRVASADHIQHMAKAGSGDISIGE